MLNPDFNSINYLDEQDCNYLLFDDYNSNVTIRSHQDDFSSQKDSQSLFAELSPFWHNPFEEDANDNKENKENNKKDKFIVKKENNTSNEKSPQLIGAKRGRQSTNPKKKKHDKLAEDNILRKFQVDYISFLTALLNDILQYFNLGLKFRKIDYAIKRNVSEKNVYKLTSKNIGDIIKSRISSKYSKTKEEEEKNNYNENIYNQIKQKDIKAYEVLTKIFSENYLKFFETIYRQDKKTINLEEYGLNQTITLSEKVKTFSDKLNDEEKLNEEYRDKIDKVINKYFANKPKDKPRKKKRKNIFFTFE